jgi:hypothetical protein
LCSPGARGRTAENSPGDPWRFWAVMLQSSLLLVIVIVYICIFSSNFWLSLASSVLCCL